MEFKHMFAEDWYEILKHYLETRDFYDIAIKINQERKKHVVLPPQGSDLLFKAFRVTPYNEVKIILMGQDIYHGDNQYDGLSFSNSTLDKPQPSLANILEEVENDVYDGFNLERISNYSLYSWAEQGVLMINAAHTVIRGKPSSHMKYWKDFTNEVVKALNKKDNIVWLMFGRFAQSYDVLIDNPTHLMLKTSHPSPYSVTTSAPIPFAGSKVFSKCNKFLKEHNIQEIIW